MAVPSALLLIAIAMHGGAPHAEPVTLNGVTFSDEEGGFVILEGRGSGSIADPFVLVEEIFADERPAILTIRGIRASFGNRLGGQPVVGFALVKVVRNRTGRSWSSFEMELRELKSRPSLFEDGLSFAQAAGGTRLYRSDRFRAVWQTDEPIDAVTFYDGIVRSGETVTMEIRVTDYSPNWQFYLIQRRQVPLAMRSPVFPRLR